MDKNLAGTEESAVADSQNFTEFHKIHRKMSVLDFLFNEASGLKTDFSKGVFL